MKREKQARSVKMNKRGLKVKYQGIVASIYGHAKRFGMLRSTCERRAKRLGVSSETLDAIFAQTKPIRLITYQGVTASLTTHRKRLGLSYSVIKRRMASLPLVPENYDAIFAPLEEGVVYQGIRDSYAGHAKRLGLRPVLVYVRRKKYGRGEDALPRVFAPVGYQPTYEYNGITDTLKGHAERAGLKWRTVSDRRRQLGGVVNERTLPILFEPPKRVRCWVTFHGIRDTIYGHAKRLGLAYDTVKKRVDMMGTEPKVLPLVFAKTPSRRVGRLMTHDGITDNLCGWAARTGMTEGCLSRRLKRMSIAEALSVPVIQTAGSMKSHDAGRRLTYNGVKDTIAGWASRLGISGTTIFRRLRNGLPLEHVLSCETHRRRRPSPGTKKPNSVRKSLAALGVLM